jgi:dTDP-4-dehydrorhamnose reductase
MRFLIFGASGQLGTALTECLTGTVLGLGRQEGDITREAEVARLIEQSAADVVINAAAYNFVDRAEEEGESAWAVNGLGCRNVARACARQNRVLVQISSDYVFGANAARRAPYSETDEPGPLSTYGVTKLAGEHFVRSLCARHFVIRTCGLYGRAKSAGKGNFIETMLRLGKERGKVSVVNDQRCTPTRAADLAAAIARLVTTDRYGLYHATNEGSVTWFELAEEIFRQSGTRATVQPISTAEFGAKALRPAYSVLDCSKLAAAIGGRLPAWQEALAAYLQERQADGRS